MIGRLNLLLIAAVLVSGFYLVRSAYESRRLFTELDRAQTEGRRLDADYQKLLADRQAQATNLRVETRSHARESHHRVEQPPHRVPRSSAGARLSRSKYSSTSCRTAGVRFRSCSPSGRS